MKRHKLMVVGAVEAGKSTLLSCLKGNGMTARKTQTVVYDAFMVDTPGEYVENPRMYRQVITTAQDVEYVIFVQDASRNKMIYPPGFAQSFNCKTIGVITKIDAEYADIEKSERILKMLCLKGPIFKTSSKTGEGIQELKEYVGL
jgi:ethanolamine utilization protein EutP